MRINRIQIPKIEDYRGNIAVLENQVVPFEIKNMYYLFEAPLNHIIAGQAQKKMQKLLIPISGSFDVILNDCQTLQTISLNKPDKGLLIDSGVWHELKNFSAGAVCLVLASEIDEIENTIADFETFVDFVKHIK